MKKPRTKIALFLALLLILALFTACGSTTTTDPTTKAPGAVAADLPTIRWTVQSCDTTGTSRYIALEQLCERLAEATNGKFTIDLYSGGTLFAIDTTIDSVKNGLVNAAFTSGDYHAGIEPMLKIAIYRCCDNWTDQFEMDEELYQLIDDLNEKAYADMGLVYVGSALMSPGEIFMSTKKIASANDFNGKLIRSSGLGADLYAQMGAGIVTMPMSDVYQATKLGTIDAFEVGSWADNYSYAYSEIVDYIIEPCPHMSAGCVQGSLIVNQESWNTLPEEYKTILNDLVDESRALSFNFTVEQDDIAKTSFENDGVEVIYLPEEETAKIKLAGAKCLAEYWDDSELCAEYLERYVAFMREKGFTEIADIVEAGRG